MLRRARLIFHGYLLRGTGSNVYNAELGQALVGAGHELHLLCQDRSPLDLPWVDAAGDWDGGELELAIRRDPPRATVYRPDIGGLLPVYVADRYEAIEARPYEDLDEAEVAAYVERNVAAVAEVVARARPDVALANHLVMGPLILARALAATGVPYAVKIHGSALEYTVKRHPRFLPAARDGLAGARGVLVGSSHTAESLWAALPEPGLREKTRLGPPGVDVTRFAPREPEAAAEGLAGLRERLLEAPEDDGPAGSSFTRSSAEAAAALGALDPGRDRIVVYVGKLIASKGVELLLAAWPLVLARVPDARLLVVGFGGFRKRSRASPPRSRAVTSMLPPPCAARTGASCPSWPRSSPGSAPGPRRTAPRPPASPTGCTGRAGSSTSSSRTCCRRRTRWRCRARSRRPSGWSRPRLPRAARCRSWPATPAWRRSRGRWPQAAPAEVRPWLTFDGRPARGEPARRRPGVVARRRSPACGRRPARRSSASRASAIPGTAWQPR